jgi:hypothetical protein
MESRAGRWVFDGQSWTDYRGLMAEEALPANFLLPILDQVRKSILRRNGHKFVRGSNGTINYQLKIRTIRIAPFVATGRISSWGL